MENENHLVSIIVPVYNAEKYIDACLQSLVSQTYKNIEIILVNDCSADKSLEVCNGWSENDNRIKVFSMNQNSGPAEARNKGMAEACGDYLTFVDSDDWLEQTCTEMALEAMKKSGADIVFWNLVHHEGDKAIREEIFEEEERLFRRDQIDLLEGKALANKKGNSSNILGLLGPYCKLYKRDKVKGCYYPKGITIGEDTCFVIQALHNAESVLYINRAYYHRVCLSGSLSVKADINFAKRRLDYVNWMLSYCKEHEIASEQVWNDFAYLGLKTVVTHYMRLKTFKYRSEALKNINYYLDNLSIRINWKGVTNDSRLRVVLLQMRMYWTCKVFYVYRDLRRKMR